MVEITDGTPKEAKITAYTDGSLKTQGLGYIIIKRLDEQAEPLEVHMHSERKEDCSTSSNMEAKALRACLESKCMYIHTRSLKLCRI